MYNLEIIAGFGSCSPSDIGLANVIRYFCYIVLIIVLFNGTKILLKQKSNLPAYIILPIAFVLILYSAEYIYFVLSFLALGFCGGVPAFYPDIPAFIPGYPDNADYIGLTHTVIAVLAVCSFMAMVYMMWLVNQPITKTKSKSKAKSVPQSKSKEIGLVIATSVFIVLALILGGWSYVMPIIYDFLYLHILN